MPLLRLVARGLAALCLVVAAMGAPAALSAQHGEHDEAVVEHGDAHEGGEHEAGVHEEGHDGGAHAEHGVELEPNRLIGQLVNFAIWAGLLWYLLKDRIPAFLTSRRATIMTELDEAARMKAEAERKFAEYEARIENLDEELGRMRSEMQKGGLAERSRIVEEAARRGEKLHAEAKFLVEQQMKQLREDLTREAIEAAIGAAERILKERTATPDQERLANEYIERLSGQLTATSPAKRKDGPPA